MISYQWKPSSELAVATVVLLELLLKGRVVSAVEDRFTGGLLKRCWQFLSECVLPREVLASLFDGEFRPVEVEQPWVLSHLFRPWVYVRRSLACLAYAPVL